MCVRDGQWFAYGIAAQIRRPQQMRSGSGSRMRQRSRERQKARATNESAGTNRSTLKKHCEEGHQPRDTATGYINAILKPAPHLLACRS